jgi:hypothetical protein
MTLTLLSLFLVLLLFHIFILNAVQQLILNICSRGVRQPVCVTPPCGRKGTFHCSLGIAFVGAALMRLLCADRARPLDRCAEMPERDEAGERLATMLQHAAASAEGQTEVTLRNLKAQDEATKAQREAIEVQRKAAEAETKAAEASVASAKAAEKAEVLAARNAKYMLWSVLVAAISAIASAVSAYYSYWSAVHPK